MIKKAGVVIQRHIDTYDGEAIFEMDSHYYVCEVSGQRSTQQLDGNEIDQEYTPIWVPIEEAIKQNEGVLYAKSAKQVDSPGKLCVKSSKAKNLIHPYEGSKP
ncbi:hypothetical protein ACFO3D_18050 [Virgibacillus kekensis]|uniref:Uncharacterized protein n=1 Tax=Virgibacillus kekensis TaxID=202261 RepID=A0ABV9DML9_9BACI